MKITGQHIAPAKTGTGQAAEKLTAIILSATPGRRMKSKGSKSLLTLNNGMSVLETQVRTIWSMYPTADIITTIGFMDSKIRNTFRGVFPVRFVYNPLYDSGNSNAVFSLALALNASLPSNLLIIHGDMVFNTASIQGLFSPLSRIFVDRKTETPSDEVGVSIQDEKVMNLSYGLPTLWNQMVFISHQDTKLLEKIVFNYELSSHWLLYEAIAQTIKHGINYLAHQPQHSKIVEINTTDDLVKARSVL